MYTYIYIYIDSYRNRMNKQVYIVYTDFRKKKKLVNNIVILKSQN